MVSDAFDAFAQIFSAPLRKVMWLPIGSTPAEINLAFTVAPSVVYAPIVPLTTRVGKDGKTRTTTYAPRKRQATPQRAIQATFERYFFTARARRPATR